MRRPYLNLLLAAALAAAGRAEGAESTIPLVRPEPKVAEAAAPDSPDDAIGNSVVKIFATRRDPDFARPWTKQGPNEVSGSGVIIEGKRILTNAHVVAYATQILVQANHAGDKVPAKLVGITHAMDLAVLELEDQSFFDQHPALPRASKLPAIKDEVMVYGFPTGGTNISITKGIVSRIEFTGYNSFASGLRIQVDAAINHGNSGGPAVADNKMIGLAFSHLGNAQNIGYIIPLEEIELFLADIADGKYDGKPGMYDELQTLENAALRGFLKLDKSVEGIVVHQTWGKQSDYPLKKWDVITRIGETRVDDQGMVNLASGLRVNFRYLIQKLAKDGKVPLAVVRGGKQQAIQLPVQATRPMLLADLAGAYPPYFVWGPLVFSTASLQWSRSGGRAAANLFGTPAMARMFDPPLFPGEEMVIVSSPFFPHKLATGYSSPAGSLVSAVNGVAIKNLRHLVQTLRDLKDEFVTIEFAGRGGEDLVFPRKETFAATEEILGDNGIRSQGSLDTLEVWGAK